MEENKNEEFDERNFIEVYPKENIFGPPPTISNTAYKNDDPEKGIAILNQAQRKNNQEEKNNTCYVLDNTLESRKRFAHAKASIDRKIKKETAIGIASIAGMLISGIGITNSLIENSFFTPILSNQINGMIFLLGTGGLATSIIEMKNLFKTLLTKAKNKDGSMNKETFIAIGEAISTSAIYIDDEPTKSRGR